MRVSEEDGAKRAWLARKGATVCGMLTERRVRSSSASKAGRTGRRVRARRDAPGRVWRLMIGLGLVSVVMHDQDGKDRQYGTTGAIVRPRSGRSSRGRHA